MKNYTKIPFSRISNIESYVEEKLKEGYCIIEVIVNENRQEIDELTSYANDSECKSIYRNLADSDEQLRNSVIAECLKNVDVRNGVIHVNRTEISHKGSDGAMVYEVRDFPKTDAGIREVILPDNYEWILRKIRVLNPFGEYLFEKDGERIRTYVIRNRLYTVCKKTEAKRKSPHKARKTYGSILIDGGVPESTVINQMGHTDIKTTKQHYYRNRRSAVQIKDEINKVEGL